MRRSYDKINHKKNKLQQFLLGFIDNIQSDEVKIEFDNEHFVIRNVEKTSVLDKLISEADDLGPEDLSINVDHYLYGLPKRRN